MAREPKDLVPANEARTPALVTGGESRTPDLYEQRFMAGQGTVLYRDKSRAGALIHAIFGAAMLSVVVSGIASGAWVMVPIVLPVLAFLWVLFAVLRVTVSSGSVKVQMGIFGPEIPIAAIESAEAVRYDWKRFGGWGIRRGLGGEWIYNMPGDGGRAVRMVWRTKRGKRRVTLVGSARAEALAAAVQGAQRALPAGAERKAIAEG